MSKKFEFHEGNHRYTLDGKPLTGVTTALGVIAKPALIGWAAKMAVEYIDEFLPVKRNGNIFSVDADDFKKTLEEAKNAHRRKKESAGDIGATVHGLIETYIKTNEFVPMGNKQIDDMVMFFIVWSQKNKVKFLESEKRLYSEKHWIGGTADFVCEIKGKKYVGDVKTSNRIYGREFFAQVAAYRLMFEEMGEKDFDGSIIIQIGKDGSFSENFSYDYETDKSMFLAALTIYRVLGSFNGNKKSITI